MPPPPPPMLKLGGGGGRPPPCSPCGAHPELLPNSPQYPMIVTNTVIIIMIIVVVDLLECATLCALEFIMMGNNHEVGNYSLTNTHNYIA